MRMLVLHIIDSLKVGGAQQLELTLAQAARSSNELALSVISLRGDEDGPLARDLRALGVSVESEPAASPFHPAVVARLVQRVRAQHPSVVHTHLTNANLAGVVAARLAGVPVVATLHNVRTRRWQRLEALLLRTCASTAIAVGRSVADAYRPWLGRLPLEVLPNPVAKMEALAPAERAGLRRTLAGEADRPLLLAVGRLTPQKGYADLLTAMGHLRERYPNFRLAIAGQGELAVGLQARIDELGLGAQVQLLGVRSDVPRLLAASDVYVSASQWEGLPVALLEAMAAGLPCVATAVGEVPHLLTPASGVCVPVGAPAQMAAAVADLLDQPARRQALGRAAQDYVARHHNPEGWVERLRTIYARVAAAPAPLARPI